MQDFGYISEEMANGFRIVLGLQLVLIALFFLISRRQRNIPLGATCLMVGLYFFWRMFLNFESNWLLEVYRYFSREILVPPLVYLFLLQLQRPLTLRDYLRHLAVPMVCNLVFLAVHWGDPGGSLRAFVIGPFRIGLLVLLASVYLLEGRKIFRELRRRMIRKAYLKYALFFYTLQAVYWFNGFVSLIWVAVTKPLKARYPSAVAEWRVSEQTDNHWVNRVAAFVNGPVDIFNDYFLLPAMYLLGIFLFLFALSELAIFKKLFLPRDLFYSTAAVQRPGRLARELRDYLDREKPYRNPAFDLAGCCSHLGCAKKELTDYLRLHEGTSFGEWVNAYRIAEFKNLLAEDHASRYDINSLAEASGFTSRATFYRIFKSLEGMTPTQYLERVRGGD